MHGDQPSANPPPIKKIDPNKGSEPRGFTPLYAAAQSDSVECLKRLIAQDGIRVNQVNMGWCLTDAEDRGQSATNRFWLAEADAASPSGRILRPEDTAASVVHLLSESASMVTGAILDISPDMLPGIMSGETCGA